MDFTLRELTPDDLSHGFLETLAGLAPVDLTVEAAREIFRKRELTGIRTFVAVDGDRVVGTASLVVEQKFIHGGGRCGHIEEVVVHPDYKNQGIARSAGDARRGGSPTDFLLQSDSELLRQSGAVL